MREKILANKKKMVALACVFLVFLGCFAFPVYNFSPDAPAAARYSGIVIALLGYSEIGLLHGALYRSKLKSAALTLGLTLVGFLCRYLLEYGEVSNTYNFTLTNIAVHLAVVLGIVLLADSAAKEID
ncbi:MAG: hypothetical protein IJF15_03400 [Oscillospiraceae bacterium]|nr:hypothetical protein [Oscillospiraceae bacterium]